ncbi:MAG: hypothetical protein PV362_15505 [Providencia heimbachae]|nr:hypothetical protein [Providencia heimbachae]
MTEQGIITVTLPDQTTQQLRTTKEMDKQLDGKFDKAGGAIIGTADVLKLRKSDNNAGIYLRYQDATGVNTGYIGYVSNTASFSIVNQMIGSSLVLAADKTLKFNDIDVMRAGDFGFGGNGSGTGLWAYWTTAQVQDFFKTGSSSIWRNQQEMTQYATRYAASLYIRSSDTFWNMNVSYSDAGVTITSGLTGSDPSTFKVAKLYSTLNTTKDSNGNLKAASPIIRVFADDIELNDESEGVEMEHLGVGHYLIKGVVGFNADGAWGINNGFVIPQDHNGKNMIIIDYEVKPDGNIELFVFHNQNIDMPERFQNKRIKHFDEKGQPIYFDNYEPCDVPESRWIDMRVEMPPNSLYNQKQAEAQRLAKIEAERLAKEEAERTEQEAAERKQYGLGENNALL